MSHLSNDMLDLLKIFNARGVEYLVVGGHAVNAYTEPRATKDIDVWINPILPNAKKVMEALREFGAPLANITEHDFIDEESFYVVGVKPNRIDILQKVPGLNFKEAWSNKSMFSLNGVDTYFLSLKDLIAAKIAAGRPQDIADVVKLKKVISNK